MHRQCNHNVRAMHWMIERSLFGPLQEQMLNPAFEPGHIVQGDIPARRLGVKGDDAMTSNLKGLLEPVWASSSFDAACSASWRMTDGIPTETV